MTSELVSRWPVTRKWLAIDRKGVRYGAQGYLIVVCMWGTFDLLVFNINLGSFSALVSNDW